MDSCLSIDTIIKIPNSRTSAVATSFQRSEFEQLLSSQLLNLSEVVETLADRVIAVEERLALIESGLTSGESSHELTHETGELLHASERKVRILRDRLDLNPQVSEQVAVSDNDQGEFLDDTFDQMIA